MNGILIVNKEKGEYNGKFYIKYLENQIKKYDYKSDKELLNRIKQLENNSKIISNNIELYDIKILIYKRNKQEYKNIIEAQNKNRENVKRKGMINYE